MHRYSEPLQHTPRGTGANNTERTMKKHDASLRGVTFLASPRSIHRSNQSVWRVNSPVRTSPRTPPKHQRRMSSIIKIPHNSFHSSDLDLRRVRYHPCQLAAGVSNLRPRDSQIDQRSNQRPRQRDSLLVWDLGPLLRSHVVRRHRTLDNLATEVDAVLGDDLLDHARLRALERTSLLVVVKSNTADHLELGHGDRFLHQRQTLLDERDKLLEQLLVVVGANRVIHHRSNDDGASIRLVTKDTLVTINYFETEVSHQLGPVGRPRRVRQRMSVQVINQLNHRV
mmetsp:Transcript_9685/g.18805  ORF Transcript_9685/g.18805 Transcript_9685/m.18805 type:complete len:283 (-) Transcript_9685:1034-1882(-)